MSNSTHKLLSITIIALLTAASSAIGQLGNVEWARSIGSQSYDFAEDVATDSDGNVFVVGGFSHELDFGGIQLRPIVNGPDIFIAKYTAAGELLWVDQIGGDGSAQEGSIAVDGQNNFYVAGSFSGRIAADDDTLDSSGERDIFLAKFDPSGRVAWARTGGSAEGDHVNDVATDPFGNVVLGATISGDALFSGLLVDYAGSGDLAVVKYDAKGNVLWGVAGGSTRVDELIALDADKNGGVVFSGLFKGAIQFGPDSLSSDKFAIWLAKIDSSGERQWARQFEDGLFAIANDIETNAADEIFMTGTFHKFLVVSPAIGKLFPATPDSSDMFIAKLSAKGEVIWAKSGGGSWHDTGTGLAVGDNGGVFVTGSFADVARFDSLEVESGPANDAYVIHYDRTGNIIGFIQSGGNGTKFDSKISRDLENIFISGFFADTLDWGNFGLTTNHEWDVYIAGIRLESMQINNTFVDVETKEACPGDTVSLSVFVDFPDNAVINSFQLYFEGFHDLAQYTLFNIENTLLDSLDWLIATHLTDSTLSIAGAGAIPIFSEGNLLKLEFIVAENAAGFIPVNLTNAVFDTGELPVQITSGGIRVLYDPVYGDVDQNGTKQAFDAALILKNLVGTADLDPQQWFNADVSLDSTLSTLDASFILSFVVGEIDSLPVPTNTDEFLASANVVFGEPLHVDGNLIDVPLQFSEAKNVRGLEGLLSFDESALEAQEINWSISDGAFQAETNFENGVVRFAGIGDVPENAEVAIIRFRIIDNARSSAKINISKLRLNEGFTERNVAEQVIQNPTVYVGDQTSNLPKSFAMHQNYPNPFNPVTQIQFDLPKDGEIYIAIYDANGRLVEVLINGKMQAGVHYLSWNASTYSSGVYFVKMDVDGEFKQVRKAVLLK